MHIIRQFFKNASGATAIEYSLITAGIAVTIIAGMSGLGTKLTAINNSLKQASFAYKAPSPLPDLELAITIYSGADLDPWAQIKPSSTSPVLSRQPE